MKATGPRQTACRLLPVQVPARMVTEMFPDHHVPIPTTHPSSHYFRFFLPATVPSPPLPRPPVPLPNPVNSLFYSSPLPFPSSPQPPIQPRSAPPRGTDHPSLTSVVSPTPSYKSHHLMQHIRPIAPPAVALPPLLYRSNLPRRVPSLAFLFHPVNLLAPTLPLRTQSTASLPIRITPALPPTSKRPAPHRHSHTYVHARVIPLFFFFRNANEHRCHSPTNCTMCNNT